MVSEILVLVEVLVVVYGNVGISGGYKISEAGFCLFQNSASLRRHSGGVTLCSTLILST